MAVFHWWAACGEYVGYAHCSSLKNVPVAYIDLDYYLKNPILQGKKFPFSPGVPRDPSLKNQGSRRNFVGSKS